MGLIKKLRENLFPKTQNRTSGSSYSFLLGIYQWQSGKRAIQHANDRSVRMCSNLS